MRPLYLCSWMLLATVVFGASARAQDSHWPVPRHARYVLDPRLSQVEMSLFVGGGTSPLVGSVQLFLGDPAVPVPLGPQAGWVGVSVEWVHMIAPERLPNQHTNTPVRFILDPKEHSKGLWNTITYEFTLNLHLTTTTGPIPVPQPVEMKGFLATYTDAHFRPFLFISGDNGPVADGYLAVTLAGEEAAFPPPPMDVWFSTEVGFDSDTLGGAANANAHVTPGDLLSASGHVVRRNDELLAKLGIMPPVPELGLDAVCTGPRRTVWFSFEEDTPKVWSETLGRWLKHGDLLSEEGRVIATNENLRARFEGMIPISDVGLDAVAIGPNRAILFSTEMGFTYGDRMNRVSHGDLLSSRGFVVARNHQLMSRFHPVPANGGFPPLDYGLDAVVLRGNAEIWFSTEIGFQDANLGWVSDGDLLSTNGSVVVRNLDLVSGFGPIQDTANFGLDAVAVARPIAPGDFDIDGDVDLDDVSQLTRNATGAARFAPEADTWDMDGDGDVDQEDFGLIQRCMGGPGVAVDVDCAE